MPESKGRLRLVFGYRAGEGRDGETGGLNLGDQKER